MGGDPGTDLSPGELDCLAVLWHAREEGIPALKLAEIHRRVIERRQRAGEAPPALTTVSTYLRTLAAKRLLQEVTVDGDGPGRPQAYPRARRLAPATRSPKTGYRVVCEPGDVLQKTFKALADAYPPSQRSRVLADFTSALQLPEGPRHLAARRLEHGMKELGASSCTFYVCDPWWPGEFRLLLMPGVQYPETMHGFNTPRNAKAVIADDGRPDGTPVRQELFLSDLRATGWLDDELSLPPSELELDRDKRLLFARFVVREGVQSCARLLHGEGNQAKASLFVNFSQRVTFTEALKQHVRGLMEDMVAFLPGLAGELQQESPLSADRLMRMLDAVHRMATLAFPAGQADVEKALGWLLGTCLDAFSVEEQTGVGTIHLFERETGTLRLAAYKGQIDNWEKVPAQSVTKGEGVIAWVALRKRPLLISDLQQSAFRQISVNIRNGIRSEMAVPMLANDETLGVINLESMRPGAFSSANLRILDHVADRAATAYRLAQEISASRGQAALFKSFLDLCRRAPETSRKGGRPLQELVRIARTSFKADTCDIWRYDAGSGEFTDPESTDPEVDLSSGPRTNGWSKYVVDRKQLVWIANVKAEEGGDFDPGDFDAFVWHPDLKSWKLLPRPAETANPDSVAQPQQVNAPLGRRRIRCELGVPILVDSKCVGVAWVKYRDTRAVPAAILVEYKKGETITRIPSIETVYLVRQFSEEAAFVMEPR
jgi:GAF domain-containing protein